MSRLVAYGSVLALATLVALAAASQPSHAAFPGSNGKIVFSTNRDSPPGTSEIYVMNADGSAQTRLTNNAFVDGSAKWSANGQQIVYGRSCVGQPCYDIVVMNEDGSGETNLTPASTWELWPAWSPDGSRIAFQFHDLSAANIEVYVMNADGTGATNLSQSPTSDDQQPAWSPDGSKIAFVTDRLGFPFHEIYVMDADGNNPVSVTTTPGLVSAPNWSPDGSRIAFEAWVGPFPVGGNEELFVMDANGANVTQLTFHAADDTWPAWSPDGTKIAFVSARDGDADAEIYTMNADGSGVPAQLTFNTVGDGSPDWQPLTGVGGLAAPPAVPDAGASSGVSTALLVGAAIALIAALLGVGWRGRRDRAR